jgi:tetratricopeptide (TPR) repeat protein
MPNDPSQLTRAYVGRALALDKQGHLLEAIVDYTRAIQADPDRYSIHLARGDVLRRFGVSEGNFYFLFLAQNDYVTFGDRALHTSDPDLVQALQAGKAAMDELDRGFDKAIRTMDQWVAKPRHRVQDVMMAFGDVLKCLRQGNCQNALPRLNRIIEFEEDFTEAYCARGFCYLNLGQEEKGRAELEKCLKLRKDHKRARQLLEFFAQYEAAMHPQ